MRGDDHGYTNDLIRTILPTMDRLLFLRNSWRESASFASELSDECVFPGPGGYLMQLVYYPDPILLKTARPLERIDGELREKTSEMFELM